MDDVLVTASRLKSFNAVLRESPSVNIQSIDFIVAIAACPSAEKLGEHRTALTGGGLPWKARLDVLHHFYLPQWSLARECPWCYERAVLISLAREFLQVPAWLTMRLAALETGLEEPLLLLAGASAPALGAGSPIADQGISAVHCAFVLASALQELRFEPKTNERLDPHFPLFQVFARANLGKYSEALLRALLLRLAAPGEWGTVLHDISFLRDLVGWIQDDGQTLVMGEVLLATLRGVVSLQALDMLAPEYEKLIGTTDFATIRFFARARHGLSP